MTRQEYDRFTEREWKGTKVKALEPLRNGLAEIPAGTVCTVTHKRNGFNLRTEPCTCCKVTVFMSRVNWRSVETYHGNDGADTHGAKKSHGVAPFRGTREG